MCSKVDGCVVVGSINSVCGHWETRQLQRHMVTLYRLTLLLFISTSQYIESELLYRTLHIMLELRFYKKTHFFQSSIWRVSACICIQKKKSHFYVYC